MRVNKSEIIYNFRLTQTECWDW